MAGYLGYSKSMNAVSAEADGLMTATEFAKWLKPYIKGVTSKDVAFILTPAEWHHTSKFYNRTNYYDYRGLAQLDVRNEFRALQEMKSDFKYYWRAMKNEKGLVAMHRPEEPSELWYNICRDDLNDLNRLQMQVERMRLELKLRADNFM